MADEIQKKILVDVQLKNDEANASINAFGNELQDVATKLKTAKAAIADAKVETAQLNAELAKGKVGQQNIKNAIDQARLSQLQANIATKAAKQAVQAASGSYDEAQKKLTALGRAIKSAENGFKSSDPAIKSQIEDYKKLNKELQAFDAKLGNHQRNVGNYKEALTGINSALSRLIPGFSQFSGILQGVSKGFSAMGSAAAESAEGSEAAEVAMTGLGAAAVGVAAAVLLVVGAIVAYISYAAKFADTSDKWAASWARFKNALSEPLEQLRTGNFSGTHEQFQQVAESVERLTTDLKELERQQQANAVATEAEDAQVRLLMLQMRDRATTAGEAEKKFQEILKIEETQYARNKQAALDEYKFTVAAMLQKYLVAGKLNAAEYNSVLTLQGGYAKTAETINKLAKDIHGNSVIAADDAQKLISLLSPLIAVDAKNEQKDQMAQNRADQRAAKEDQYNQKQKQLQEESARITEQANSERMASVTRMMLNQQEAFERSLSEVNEKARQSVFKLQQEISKQQSVANNSKNNDKTRAAARQAILAINNDIKEIQSANYDEIQQMAVDHNRKMLDEVRKGALDVLAAQNENIDNAQKRDLANIENQYQQHFLKLKEDNAAYQDTIRKLNKEISETQIAYDKEKSAAIKEALGNELQALKTTLNAQNVLLGQNADLVVANEKKKEKAIDKTNKKYQDEANLIKDQIALLADKKAGANLNPLGKANKQQEGHEIQLVEDEKQKELDVIGLTEKQKQLIVDQSEDKITEIKKSHAKSRMATVIDYAQMAENAAFTIIQQSLQRQNQAAEQAMQKQQAHDLQNTALTATQKYEIEEKYKAKEAQLKIKEFNQEKELALVKGAIDTAAAILKASPDVPLMVLAGATGALELATIAAQKPPAAYAYGGEFKSDGKGAVLPGYSRTDNTNAYLRSGEAVIVSEAVRDPYARSVLSGINQAFGGRAFDNPITTSPWLTRGFASGGISSSQYLPTSDNGLRPSVFGSMGNSRMHPGDVNGIVNGIVSGVADAVNNLPAPVMDVKDVNRQQDILATAQDRRNF